MKDQNTQAQNLDDTKSECSEILRHKFQLLPNPVIVRVLVQNYKSTKKFCISWELQDVNRIEKSGSKGWRPLQRGSMGIYPKSSELLNYFIDYIDCFHAAAPQTLNLIIGGWREDLCFCSVRILCQYQKLWPLTTCKRHLSGSTNLGLTCSVI